MKPPEDMIESLAGGLQLSALPLYTEVGGEVVEVPWGVTGSPSKSYNLCV